MRSFTSGGRRLAGHFQLHRGFQVPDARRFSARFSIVRGGPDLKRHLDYQRFAFDFDVEGKRTDAEHVAGGQRFIFLQRLSIQHDRIAGPQITDVVIALGIRDARVQARHGRMIEQ